MRGTELADTGLEFDVAGGSDVVVALVQRAVEHSGSQAQATRHYVAIDGGTSADIRLRVASIDTLAPLLVFAITTARSAQGTAAATFILQHSVQKRRRHRSLIGEEPFVAFLESLAALAVEHDPRATVTLRVRGARRSLGAPRAAAVPEMATDAPPSPLEETPPAPTAPDAASEAAPAYVAAQVKASPTDVPAPAPASAATTSTVSVPPPTSVPAPGPTAEPAPAPQPTPAPETTPAPEPSRAPAVAPQVVPVASAPDPRPSMAPELQITIPPGLIAPPPGLVAEDQALDGHAIASAGRQPTPPAGPATPTTPAAPEATIVSTSSSGRTLSLVLPDGGTVPLVGAVLLGRNPAAHAEYRGAALQAVADPRMSVSKTHTAVIPGRRSVRVTDLHSTNGTTVTDPTGAVTVCVPGESYPVEPGWTIGIGEFPVRVVAEDH